MDMSAACTMPTQPQLTAAQEKHPLAQEYRVYRSGMTRLMVQADRFEDWLHQRDREELEVSFTKHERFPEFQKWMQDNQGGARGRMPAPFPHNFRLWLDGARW